MKGQIITAQKGTKDVLPNESYKWHYLEDKIKEVTRLYNIKEVRTPMFEATELFLRGVGDSTDIVNKEMYTFLDKGDRSITLKPEGTAGVVRSYIENGLFNEPQPIKCYYVSSIFRYERPQKGRLREHHQFGIEYFGSNSPLADAEVIMVAVDFIKSFGIKNVSVNINSIGNEGDRENYKAKLRDYFKNQLNDLCSDCQNRYNTNVLRLLDCKVDMEKEVVKNAPSILNSLSEESMRHFEAVKKELTVKDIKYTVNDKIVRGLDYYTGTVFEIIGDDIEGPSKVICGGGRYNNLVEELGGKPEPAVGFGMGLERVLMLLDEFKISIPEPAGVDVYVISSDKVVNALEVANELRERGVSAEVDLLERGLNAQLNYANKIGAKFVMFASDNSFIELKNMKNGVQEPMTFEEAVEFIKFGKRKAKYIMA
ncbi:MAG: histidine--tRNA ligase [Spirochaetales bacterium]